METSIAYQQKKAREMLEQWYGQGIDQQNDHIHHTDDRQEEMHPKSQGQCYVKNAVVLWNLLDSCSISSFHWHSYAQMSEQMSLVVVGSIAGSVADRR